MHSSVNATAVTLALTFKRLWLPLKGISIEKTYIGKFSYTIHSSYNFLKMKYARMGFLVY
jgi:hypothetical protein